MILHKTYNVIITPNYGELYMLETLDLQQIFVWISLFSTILFILKTLIFFITGGDAEVHSDFISISDTDAAFSLLSLQTILAFFMGFGWMGLVGLNQIKLGTTFAITIAFFVGLFFMFATAFLMFSIKKLNQNTKINLEDCIGKEGKAYQNIAPQSEGQIEIVINKKLVIIDAFNLEEEQIEAFQKIRVEKVEENKLYIRKI